MPEGAGQLVIIGVFFAVMYFMLIRPQRQRQAQQEAVLRSLEPGMDVVTIGGLHGTIEEVADDYVDLLVTDDVVLRYRRASISEVVSPVTADVAVDEDATENDDT